MARLSRVGECRNNRDYQLAERMTSAGETGRPSPGNPFPSRSSLGILLDQDQTIHGHDHDRAMTMTDLPWGGVGRGNNQSCLWWWLNLLFHLLKIRKNPLRKIRIFSKDQDHDFGAAPAGSDASPRDIVYPNAAGAKMISFKSVYFH